MDRRQKKTRDAIFRAFGSLLETKRYERITVQEIIEKADIGRSTFYAHFETKDELLRAMCTDIFHHIFTEELPQETNTVSSGSCESMELKLGHILYHLRENNLNIKGLLCGDSSELFLSYFREYMKDFFIRYLDIFKANIPQDFLLNHLVGSFAEAVKWWVHQNMMPSPEKTAEYYMTVINDLT